MDELVRMGCPTKKVARKVTRELESVRSDLVHSHDIVTNDWARIARMTQCFEAIFLDLV